MKRHESSKPEAENEPRLSRRDFLEVGSGALAAVGVGSIVVVPQDQSVKPGPERSTSDPGQQTPRSMRNPATSNHTRHGCGWITTLSSIHSPSLPSGCM